MNAALVASRLSVERGATRPDFLRDETLAEIFAQTVAAHPTRVAIVSGDQTLTYAELDAVATRWASAMQAEGVGVGHFVGLWMPRGRDVLIAQLAIAKTGAAWIPFDADAPADRVSSCLKDVGAIGIIGSESWTSRIDPLIRAFTIEGLSASRATALANAAIGTSPAYVIYTSGSTGKPKGIVVSQSNICHFLRAAADVYALSANDRMLQCGSIAFDLSMEEIWVPYLVGAQLEVCPAETLADPDRLVALIDERGVTVMDVVPTLLALIEADLPSVRLIIVGGEACPEAIVARYATAQCRLINSYGPSEATVAVTAKPLHAGEPVTIGTPLANTSCYVVDDALQLLPRGQIGELLLGGPQVAQGYVARPELTAEKFIANPFSDADDDPVLYRTGDAVEMRDDGDLVFTGRIDEQVKLRGFRIELGEVETALARELGIAQAAVVLHKNDGGEMLVAFVTLQSGASLDPSRIKASLRKQLPPYMVPTVIEKLSVLPRLLASGKIDRNALAAFPLTVALDDKAIEVPKTATEAALMAVAAALFPSQPISFDADFFLDLGGHSLLAAQFISAVRKHAAFEHITLGNVYEARTLRRIAALIDASAPSLFATDNRLWPRASASRRFWCGLAQAAVTPFILTMMSAPWLAIFISYSLVSPENSSLVADTAIVFFAYAAINLVLALMTVAIKWVVLGRTKPGRYPLWGSYYFRVWLVQRLLMLVHLKWMQNTPVLRAYLRLLGADVGHDALISDFDVGAIDLLEIGDHASTGSKTVFANAHVDGGDLVIGRIRIGKDVSIGSSCVIEGGADIGEGAELADLTSIAAGTTIPAWTKWSGAPALKIGDLNPSALPLPPGQNGLGRVGRFVAYFVMLVTIPAISIVPIVPAFRIMEWLDTFVQPVLRINYLYYMPVLAMSAAAAMIAFTLILAVACRWIFLPRVRPGRYAVTSNFYLRRWGVSLLIDTALDTVSSLFATLYMRVWYRAMGSKIGKGTEISTSFAGRYELIELGAGNFIADDVIIGDDELRRNWMHLDTIRTGDQVFIGNEAVVPQGYSIGSNALIGVKSRPPEGGVVESGAIWFGSPPIALPTRQRFEHDERQTFRPKRRMVIGRALFEAFNVCLPSALFITLVTIVMEVLAPVFDRANWGKAIWICVLASSIIALVQLAVAVAYKWLLMGRYRPTVKPMWSWWALRTEATAVMYWGMAGKALLDALRGTPFLPIALRLFGVKTGRGVYLDSADITEFDCVQIDDNAVINNHAVLQTHLYEDRLMKIGTIHVGQGAIIGAGSTVLYDTHIGDDARLGPLTMVMKGESIPARSSFGGSPARPSSGTAINAAPK